MTGKIIIIDCTTRFKSVINLLLLVVMLDMTRPLDLTMTISDTLPTFPDSPSPQFIKWSDLKRDGYNLELLFASTHSGTHIDAPYHFDQNGIKVNQIKLRDLIGSATLVRLEDGRAENPNYLITKHDICAFEKSSKGHRILSGMAVIFHTGWQKSHIADKDFFLSNPGLDRSAARYLASRGVRMVGTDSPSIDAGCDSSFAAHRILAKAGIPIVENLANLEKIRAVEFDLVVLPLKLKGASGSPVRAMALSR